MRVVPFTLAALAACSTADPYLCALDADCGAGGHCEADLHCSLDDSSCASGRRYVAASGEVANTCTDENTVQPTNSEYQLCGVTAALPDPTGTCAKKVCATDAACCTVGWDQQCARTAQARCDLGCDLVIAAGGYSSGSVFRTGSVGTSLFTIPHNNWNYTMAWGDIEGDGKSDLAVARNVGPTGTDGVVIFQSSGLTAGKLVMTPASIVGSIGSVSSLEWRDFDADGDLDLLASGASGVYLVVTDGSTFTAHPLTTAGGYAVWIDHDGQAPWRIATFMHVGADSPILVRDVTLSGGAYAMSAGTSLGTQESALLTWCNLSGSPERDLVTGDQLRVANATGFATPMPMGTTGHYPECADLDGDGDNDVILGSYDKAAIVINDAGLSGVPLVVPTINVGGIAIGDFDKNGRLDVMLSNNTSERAEVPLVVIDSTPSGFTTRELPDWNTPDWDSAGIEAGPLPKP